MKCHECGAPRAVLERICRGCHLDFERGVVLTLVPPRAADPRPAHVELRTWARSLHGSAGRRLRGLGQTLTDTVGHHRAPLAGVVPGLGHVVRHESTKGVVWFGTVLGLAGLSALWFSTILGQSLFGLALGLHAYSIFELTNLRELGWKGRTLSIVVIQLGLAFLWAPVFRFLATTLVAPLRVGYRRDDSATDLLAGRAVVAVLITLAVLAVVGLLLRLFRREVRE